PSHFCFFFHDTATTEIYTLSLHDALPIWRITVRQLLNHTSGLRHWGEIEEIAGWPRGTREYRHSDVLDIVGRQRALNYAPRWRRDRKSTRLNSSHDQISYAVFCLKKKNKP